MIKNTLLFLSAIIYFNASAQTIPIRKPFVLINDSDTQEQIIRKAAQVVPTADQDAWQRLELTAFFHFGINTFTNNEWGSGKDDPKLFNPEKLNATQWIKTVKSAGFKQVILTAKHHDGFCLWPSKFTNYSVKQSAWKNGKGDVVKEVADACHKNEMRFGVYLSPWDRNSPLYGTEKYNDYFVNQLTELLNNYGQVDEVWFDGACGEGPNGKKQIYDFKRWYEVIRKLQPLAVIAIMGPDIRWVGTESGYAPETQWSVVAVDSLIDEVKFERSSLYFIPKGAMMGDHGSREVIYKAKALAYYPAETDVSIRKGWFYHQTEDSTVKSPEKLFDIYFHSVGRNTVLLLNIPPDKNGLINEYDVNALSGFKKLLDETFGNNLAKNAEVSCNNCLNSNVLIDGDDRDHIHSNELDTNWNVELKWKQPQTFDVIMLQENITAGQRIEKFVIEKFENNNWIKITEGTTVGHKRLLRFQKTTADNIRLRILSCRLNPALAEFGVFLQPENLKEQSDN